MFYCLEVEAASWLPVSMPSTQYKKDAAPKLDLAILRLDRLIVFIMESETISECGMYGLTDVVEL